MSIACKYGKKNSVFEHVLRCNVSLRNTRQKTYFLDFSEAATIQKVY